MVTWKKVIVSGSIANLAGLQVSDLVSGQVVIGGGSSQLTTTPINGTGDIVATTGATGMSASGSFSGSFFGNFVGTADLPDLTNGTGISSFVYDGQGTATVAVSGAASLSSNVISKWTGNAFANSSLTDNGTIISGATSIQLSGANSSLTGSFTGSFIGNGSGLIGVPTTLNFSGSTGSGSVALLTQALNIVGTTNEIETSASGQTVTIGLPDNVTITGDLKVNGANIFSDAAILNIGTQATLSTINIGYTGNTVNIPSNTIVGGDLTVNGTTTFINTQNLYVKDRFIEIASGSSTLLDAGIVAQYNAAGSGSAIFLSSTPGTYGRFAVAYDVLGTSTSVAADEYVVTAKINQASNPSAAPTWGNTGYGTGNMWITNSGDIYIYA